jgi:hypothetical protein
MLHAPPISFSFPWSYECIWWEVYFLNLPITCILQYLITATLFSSAPYAWTPQSLPLVWETKFHTHIKEQARFIREKDQQYAQFFSLIYSN